MKSESSRFNILYKVLGAVEALYDFTRVTIREFSADKLTLRSLALAFGSLLSLLPLLGVLFSLFKILGGGEWFLEVMRPVFSNFLAPGIQPVVTEKVARLLTNFAAKTVASVSFLLLIFGLHTIFASVESTFNLIWGGAPKGRLLVRAPIYWGLFLTIPLLLGGAIAFTTYIVALPLTAEVSIHIGYLQSILRRAIPATMIIVSMVLLFKYLTSALIKWKSAIVGGVIAGILYEISKYFFIFYASQLVQYDALYGSIAIVPMAMIWVSITWFIALLGMEIAYVFQHFNKLRHEKKHILLSRRQQDALAIRFLLAAIDSTNIQSTKYLNPIELAGEWEVPPGAALEALDRLRRAELIRTPDENSDSIVISPDVENFRVEQILHALETKFGEEWRHPEESQWDHIMSLLGNRIDNSEFKSLTLKDLVPKSK